MSTNYYLYVSKTFGRFRRGYYHIGKISGGWKFAFNIKFFTCLKKNDHVYIYMEKYIKMIMEYNCPKFSEPVQEELIPNISADMIINILEEIKNTSKFQNEDEADGYENKAEDDDELDLRNNNLLDQLSGNSINYNICIINEYGSILNKDSTDELIQRIILQEQYNEPLLTGYSYSLKYEPRRFSDEHKFTREFTIENKLIIASQPYFT